MRASPAGSIRSGGFVYDLLGLWAIVLVVAAASRGAGRSRSRRSAPSCWPVVLALVSTRSRWVIGPPLRCRDPRRLGQLPRFTAVGVGEAAAVVLTVAPHLVRPLQTAGAGRRARVLRRARRQPDHAGRYARGFLLAAVAAAAGVRLAFGTSAGQARTSTVAAALRELGVVAEGLAVAERQVAGVLTRSGLTIRAAGRCSSRSTVATRYDTQVVAKFWRTLWYQDGGPRLRLSRAQAAEHEAFVTLLARNGGVPTREVVTAGATVGRGRPRSSCVGRRCGSRRPRRTARRRVAPPAAGTTLALLGEANIAHLQIDPATVAVSATTWRCSTSRARPWPPSRDQLQTDRVQLLVTTATRSPGPSARSRAAVDSLGADGRRRSCFRTCSRPPCGRRCARP